MSYSHRNDGLVFLLVLFLVAVVGLGVLVAL